MGISIYKKGGAIITNIKTIKTQKNKKDKFSLAKVFFEKIYILPIIVFLGIIFVYNYNSQASNRKLVEYLENLPLQFNATDAIHASHVVNYGGVITNIDLLYDFEKDCKSGKTSQVIYTIYNDNMEPTIKTAFYNNGKIYVNTTIRSKDNNESKIEKYKFSDYEIIDDENTLTLTFKDKKNEFVFLNYNKKTEKSN